MKLRTITIGLGEKFVSEASEIVKELNTFLNEAKVEFAQEEIQVRTFRLLLTPFQVDSQSSVNQQKIIGEVAVVNDIADAIGVRWFNVPFNLTKGSNENLDLLNETAMEVLKRFPKTFINLIVTANKEISFNAGLKASDFIRKVSQLDNSGYHNFRVGASANVKANTPFFPFTYSSPDRGFSIGLELPQEFNKIVGGLQTTNLDVIREEIIKQIQPKVRKVDQIAKKLAENTGLKYHGIDFSLAPYPEPDGSVAELIEKLGPEQQGSNGTLFVTAFLTDILKTLAKDEQVKENGFNGVMFSLLEDEHMGRRNNTNNYTIDSLLLYSSVCGCGLDMVPIPGDTFTEEIASMLLDTATLSSYLDKPLGLRVLPIPMKYANEFTVFNMDFLFNTRVKKVKGLSFLNSSVNNLKFITKSKNKEEKKISLDSVKIFWENRAKQSVQNEGLTNLEPNDEKRDLKIQLEEQKINEYITLLSQDNLLDLGGGYGEWAFKFAPFVKKVHVVDYCSELVELGKKKAIEKGVYNIKLECAPAQEFITEQKYETVFISGLLIYLNDENIQELLENIDSYTKEGTTLILRDGTGIKEKFVIKDKWSEALQANYSAMYRTREKYVEIFKSIGFELEKDEDMFREGCELNKFPETRLRIYKFRKIK